MTARQKAGRYVTLASTLLGAAAATYLVRHHVVPIDDGLCTINETFNCAGAAASPWATILGIPIALLGLAFYVGVFALWLRDRGTGDEGEAVSARWMLPPLFAGAVGYSVVLFVVSIVSIGSLCPMCMVMYAANIGGLVGAVLWTGAPVGRAIGRGFADAPRLVMPDGVMFLAHLVVVTVAGMVLIKTLADRPQMEPVGEPVVNDDPSLHASEGPAKGPADAPVVIVEFSDFQCPYCSRLAATLEQIGDEFGDDVRIEFRHFPLPFHEHAEPAARAAYCAGEQGRFWEFHDILFERQRQFEEGVFSTWAGELDLDTAAFDACVASDQAREAVATDVAAGDALGVTGTPAFYVNGVQYVGAWPYDDIAAVVRSARGGGGAPPPGGGAPPRGRGGGGRRGGRGAVGGRGALLPQRRRGALGARG